MMSAEIDFTDNISQLRTALEQAKAELAELEERAQQYTLKTEEARQVLKNLKQVLRGELPRAAGRQSAASMRPLKLNEDTGRPSRGARRTQIEAICRKLGQNQRQFRSVDVLNTLREIEQELTPGMKSYTYAVMTTLETEGFINKVGRGTWQLS